MKDNKNQIVRRDELRVLNRFTSETERGAVRLVLLSGQSGTGKSTLLRQLEVPQSTKVIFTSLFEHGNAPYSLPADFIRKAQFDDEFFSILEKKYGKYLGYFLPERDVPIDQEISFNLLSAIFGVIVQEFTNRQALLWIIEDLQWADISSLEILTNITGQALPIPFTVIATYRTEDVNREHPLRKMRANLRRTDGYEEIKLKAFNEKQVEEFLKLKFKSIPSASFISAMQFQTSGLPLLLDEVSTLLQHKKLLKSQKNGEISILDDAHFPIPESVRDLVFLQMEELSPPAAELAELAACYKMEFSFEFIEKFTTDSQCIDELLQSGIIYEINPGSGSFRHALYRESIRSEIPWSKRKAIYRRLAETLEKESATPAVLAELWENAGVPEKSRPAYVLSARESCNIMAYQDAARWAEKALKSWPENVNEEERIEVLKEYARCSRINGDMNNAIKALKEIVRSNLAVSNVELLANALRELALNYKLKGSWHLFFRTKQQSISKFLEMGSYDEVATDRMELAGHFFKEVRHTETMNMIEEALDAAGKAGRKDMEARALGLNGYLLAARGESEKGYQMASEAVKLALSVNDTTAAAETYRWLAGTLEYASSFQKSLEAYDFALNFCTTHGLEFDETQCMGCMAWVLLRLGDWRKCFEICRSVIEHPSAVDLSKCTIHVVLSLIRAYRGELKSAKRSLETATRIARHENSTLHELIALWPSAVVAMIENNRAGAFSDFQNLLDLWEKTDDMHDSIPGFCDALSFFIDNGHEKEINRSIAALSAIANDTKNPEAFGILSFGMGAGLLIKEQFSEAAIHFNKSIEYLENLKIPLQTAIVRFYLAKTFLAIDKEELCLEHLESAYSLFRKMGIRFWCARIDDFRDSLKRDMPDTPKEETRSTLTQRQSEILELLIQGLSNKEIAADMHLSTRTVDMHVRNIFDRLNCRTRAEATRIALQTGIVQSPKP